MNEKLSILDNVNALFKNTKNVVQSVQDLIDSNSQMQKELERIEKERAKNIKTELKKSIVSKDGINFLDAIVPLDGGAIKDILFQLKGEVTNLFAVVGGESDEIGRASCRER